MGFGSDKTGFYKPSAVTVTASGNPLTLQNAKRLRKLTICGNAVQDGTPSPDAPVEVQLCGDRTGNLLDYDVFDNAPEYISDLSSIGCFAISVPNGAYTMSTNIEIKNNLNAGAFLIANSLPDTITSPLYGVSLNHPRTVTVSNGTLYVCVYWRNAGTGASYPHVFTKEDFTSGTYWLMLVQGSYTADTLPAYEPYGYKVSGRAEGLNLLDKDSYNIVSKVVAFSIANLKNGEKYTFYSDKPVTWFKISNNQGGHTSVAKVDFTNGFNAFSFTMARNENIAEDATQYLFLSTKSTIEFETDISAFDNYRLAIYKGTYTAETIPPYEPYQPPQDFAVYLPEQIAKVGDVADEVVVDMEKQTAELKKNVGSVVVSAGLTLSATGSKGDDIALFYKLFPDRFIANSETVSVMSDKLVGLSLSDYKNSSSKDMLSLAGNNTNTAVFMKLSKTDIGGDTAESANTWIADNRITVYYVLATPVTTDITSLQQWDAMPQVSGTVTLTLSAEVEPSGTEAVYTATKRPKAQAALIEENTEEPAETQVSDTDINTEIIMMED